MSEHEKIVTPRKKDDPSNSNHEAQSSLPGLSYTVARKAILDPMSLTHSDIMQLQKTIGNRAVIQLMKKLTSGNSSLKPVQREASPEEESLLEEPGTAQKEQPAQLKRNSTGLPDGLKSGVESLSGLSLDTVRVSYNSDKPQAIGALAYTQGTDIHVAPGQERHLPHEAWHVVQQAQGRVQPTMQLPGAQVNDDIGLEEEADEMGAKAIQLAASDHKNGSNIVNASNAVVQREVLGRRIANDQFYYYSSYDPERFFETEEAAANYDILLESRTPQAAEGGLRRSTRTTHPELTQALRERFNQSLYRNLNILYDSVNVPTGTSGGDEAPQATMAVNLLGLGMQTVGGQFHEGKHCETDIYDSIFGYYQTGLEQRGIDLAGRQAATFTEGTVSGHTLHCGTASCFLCTAVMAVIGVKPQTKFREIYSNYVLPKVITESPDNMMAFLGREAWEIYISLSPDNQHNIWGSFMGWLGLNHRR